MLLTPLWEVKTRNDPVSYNVWVNWGMKPLKLLQIIVINARWSHYLFSDWRKAYSEFSKSAPGTSGSNIQ